MNALSYLQPENQVAKGIVVILLTLFVIWLALLVYGGLRLRAQERRMRRCDKVESLAQTWRSLITIEGSSGGGDDRALDADNHMRLHSQVFDAPQHAVDHLLRGMGFHHDDHKHLSS